nr:hypothetical protein [Tanacetum cinerariifolium]
DNTSKKMVYLFELRNDECVSGVDVSIPLAYFDELIGKSVNVHGESSTYQPREMVHTNTQPAVNKDDVFETDKSDWQKSNNSESTINDNDSEEVDNVFVKDNGKPIDDLVDDARKKVEAPPRRLPGKLVRYRNREDIEEVEHENACSKKS